MTDNCQSAISLVLVMTVNRALKLHRVPMENSLTVGTEYGFELLTRFLLTHVATVRQYVILSGPRTIYNQPFP